MSGREHEPLSAFFPSIDRNLMLDLDRHLRGGAPAEVVEATPAIKDTASAAPRGLRPDIGHMVEAVEHAAQTIAAMSARIEDLESHIDKLEAANGSLGEKLTASQRHAADLDARLKDETERADRVEAVATQQAGRAAALDRELNAAHGDLARITDAIAATLGFPQKT